MSEDEILVLVFSVFYSWGFLSRWYGRLGNVWGPCRRPLIQYTLGFLPPVVLAAMIFTLTTVAAFDVVGSSVYIFFYVALGFALIYLGLNLMQALFDLSWIDDVINLKNEAALPAVTGGVLGLTAIYCGANIGDGPGWWCVVFAGGLGFAAWLTMGLVLARGAHTFERITIDRDMCCGLRTGCYLLASGLILGRASGGDWSGFTATVMEFSDGWPVLPLTALALIVERRAAKNDWETARRKILPVQEFPVTPLFWGTLYLTLALIIIMLLPPMFDPPRLSPAETSWLIRR